MFYRLEELLVALMRRDADLAPASLRRKKYLNTALLIIDEVGFEPMTRQEASLFFRLVSLPLPPGLDPDHHQQERARTGPSCSPATRP